MDSIRRLASYRPAYDTVTLLSRRYEWRVWRRKSPGEWRRTRAVARAIRRGHRGDARGAARCGNGRDGASALRARFRRRRLDDARLVRRPAARRVADIVLSFQAPNGGLVETRRPDAVRLRRPARATSRRARTGNGSRRSTTIRRRRRSEFLALADSARPDARYRARHWPRHQLLAGDAVPERLLPARSIHSRGAITTRRPSTTTPASMPRPTPRRHARVVFLGDQRSSERAAARAVERASTASSARRCTSTGRCSVGAAARSADARPDERAELRAHVARVAGNRRHRQLAHEHPVAERSRVFAPCTQRPIGSPSRQPRVLLCELPTDAVGRRAAAVGAALRAGHEPRDHGQSRRHQAVRLESAHRPTERLSVVYRHAGGDPCALRRLGAHSHRECP